MSPVLPFGGDGWGALGPPHMTLYAIIDQMWDRMIGHDLYLTPGPKIILGVLWYSSPLPTQLKGTSNANMIQVKGYSEWSVQVGASGMYE